MTKILLSWKANIPNEVGQVFTWHERPGAFQRLAPPWQDMEVVRMAGGIRDGAQVELKLKLGPISIPWHLQHQNYVENKRFEDIQIKGPFAAWKHTHQFSSLADKETLLEDTIEFQLPGSVIGKALGQHFCERELNRLFGYRERVLKNDFAVLDQFGLNSPLSILVSGASGFVGSSLVPFLTVAGHQVTCLTRSHQESSLPLVLWNPARKQAPSFEDFSFDSVVHLAGENVASGRWTDEKKQIIRESRLTGTRLLAEAIAALDPPPRVMIVASGVGYYGDRGDEPLNEDSAKGEGFLSELSSDWEAAVEPAVAAGIRVIPLRIGLVLSPAGGALRRMLPPFFAGVGGKLGDGEQFVSWITIDDLLYLIYHLIHSEGMSGPVNAVAPNPVTNAEFTEALGKVLGRPTILPLPAAVIRALFGEMGESLLLASTKVIPARAIGSGFKFAYPDLESALCHTLGRVRCGT